MLGWLNEFGYHVLVQDYAAELYLLPMQAHFIEKGLVRTGQLTQERLRSSGQVEGRELCFRSSIRGRNNGGVHRADRGRCAPHPVLEPAPGKA